MNKILISTFGTEKAAFEGLSALKDLHESGDITLYASSVIAKDPSGAVSVRQAADSGPVGTLVGMVTGGLIGLLGGPAGVAVGAYVGGFGGLMYDLINTGMSGDFVDEVSAALTPGTVAVVADIDESWVTPVDTRLGALGGTTPPLPGRCHRRGARPRDRGDEQGTRAAECRAPGRLRRGEGEHRGGHRAAARQARCPRGSRRRRSLTARPNSRRGSAPCAPSTIGRVRSSASTSRNGSMS